MNRTSITIGAIAATVATLGSTQACAQEVPPNRLGEHPAIIAGRLHADTGYDYASKMYRHPAGLELLAAAPRTMSHHPAVLVHRQWSQRGYDYASNMYRHPAGLALFAEAPRERGDHPAVLIAKVAGDGTVEQAPQFAGHHPALSITASARRMMPPQTIATVGLRKSNR